MNYYLKVLQNYFTFSGRATRSEYWYFVLFNMIFAIVAIILDNVLDTTFKFGYEVSLPYGYIYLFYLLLIIIPSLAVAVRRLHDVGKSGWFFLISLIPIIGGVWLLVLLATDSVQTENKYGANPKIADLQISE
jgi:uncharacterized membrane protein YhaH (DUF805 family)